jgi:hypothetical protein
MATQRLRHRLDLSGRDALDIHFRQSTHQSLLPSAGIAQTTRSRTDRAVLRDTKLERANAGDQRTVVIASASPAGSRSAPPWPHRASPSSQLPVPPQSPISPRRGGTPHRPPTRL